MRSDPRGSERRRALARPRRDLTRNLLAALIIGGLIAFGLVGIFVGPVVLAVSDTLRRAWVIEQADDAKPHAAQDQQAALDPLRDGDGRREIG